MLTKLRNKLFSKQSNHSQEVKKMVELSLSEHEDPILVSVEDRVSGAEFLESVINEMGEDSETADRLRDNIGYIKDGTMKLVVNNMPVPLGVKAITEASVIGFQGKGKNGALFN